MSEVLRTATQHLEYLYRDSTDEEIAGAIRMVAKAADNPEDYLHLLGALGLDDDAHRIGQAEELAISDAATGPLTSGSGSDKVMP